jgi:hypothetical protein
MTVRPGTGPRPVAAAELDPLAQVAAENPEFRIWRETTSLGTRYICRSLDLRVNPYTLVTIDLDEMAVMLSDARRRREQRPPSPVHAVR